MAQPARPEHGTIPSTSHTASQTKALWILATLLIPIVLALLLSLVLAPGGTC